MTEDDVTKDTAPSGNASNREGIAGRFSATTVRETRPETRTLTPAARRALAEAEERRKRREAEAVHAGDLPKEVNGRNGPEPIRYGDWEKNGIISDF